MRGAKLVLRFVVSGLALAAFGCGGGGDVEGGDGPEVATTEGGQVIRTASGGEVTVEAHNNWRDGMALFTRLEHDGWNASGCDGAVAKFEAANEAQGGGFAEALYMAGLAASRCNDTRKARGFYEQALEANPEMCRARAAIGLIELEAGDEREARELFERSVQGSQQCAAGYTNLAILQRRSGNQAQVEEALANLRRALAVESDYLPAFSQMALLYYERGLRGDTAALDLAEIVSRQAQLINENYAPIYNTWGLVKIQRGDVIEALRFFERAIAIDDSLFEAQMNFAQITLSFRGYEDARRSFARAVELRPNDYTAILGLGAALRGLGQIDQAKAQYERAIEVDGARPEAYFNIGLLYQDYMDSTVPQLQQAVRYYDQFLERARNNQALAEASDSISRRCRDQRTARQRRRNLGPQSDCRPGRKQTIEMFIEALNEAEQMQREAEAMQREAEQVQREAEQQQGE